MKYATKTTLSLSSHITIPTERKINKIPDTFELIQQAHRDGIKHIFTTDLNAEEWGKLTNLRPESCIYQPVRSSACYVLGRSDADDLALNESAEGRSQEDGGLLRETFEIGQQVYTANVPGSERSICLTYDEAVDVLWQAMGGSVRLHTMSNGEHTVGEMYLTSEVHGKGTADIFGPADTFKINRLIASTEPNHGIVGSCVTATMDTKRKRLNSEEAVSLLTGEATEPRLLVSVRHRNGRKEQLGGRNFSRQLLWSTVDKTGFHALIEHIEQAKMKDVCRRVVSSRSSDADLLSLAQGLEQCLILDRDGDRQYLYAGEDSRADIFLLALAPPKQSKNGKQPDMLGKDQIWKELSKKVRAVTSLIASEDQDTLSIEGEASETEIDLEAQGLPLLEIDPSGTVFPSGVNMINHMVRKQLWEGKRELEIVQSDRGSRLIWRSNRDSRSFSTSVAERSIVLTEEMAKSFLNDPTASAEGLALERLTDLINHDVGV